ncbi:DNA ligase 1-like [Centruroides vittatus]|uniref:DNA ligase 1-like n=1 Tax=Centruroides vittatus TaxID=120091 RepID=UPI00350FD4F8
MEPKNCLKEISQSLNNKNNSKVMSSWERRKLYSKQMYQKQNTSKVSQKKVQISKCVDKQLKEISNEKKIEENDKTRKRKSTTADTKQDNKDDKENTLSDKESSTTSFDSPVPRKLRRRDSFTICEGPSPMILKTNQRELSGESIIQSNKTNLSTSAGKYSGRKRRRSSAVLTTAENETVDKKQKLLNDTPETVIENKTDQKPEDLAETCNQKNDSSKQNNPPKPGSGAATMVKALNDQNETEKLISAEGKLSRKEQLMKWKKEQEEKKLKRMTVCPIISEKNQREDQTSLINFKKEEGCMKANNELKNIKQQNRKSMIVTKTKPNIVDNSDKRKMKQNAIPKSRPSLPFAKSKEANNGRKKLDDIKETKDDEILNRRKSTIVTKHRFTTTNNDLQKKDNFQKTKSNEILKSRPSLAVANSKRFTMAGDDIQKIEIVKKAIKIDNILKSRRSIAVVKGKTSKTNGNLKKMIKGNENVDTKLLKNKNVAKNTKEASIKSIVKERSKKQVPLKKQTNNKIPIDKTSQREGNEKNNTSVINKNQTRRSISSLFHAGQLEKAKSKIHVNKSSLVKLPEKEELKSIIKSKSSIKKSVNFNTKPGVGVSGKQLPKTPMQKLNIRQRLESWLDDKGNSLSNFYNINCFGHYISELKLQKSSAKKGNASVEFKSFVDSLGGSPLLKVRNSPSEDEVLTNENYNLEKALLELKELLQIGYPPSSITEWLYEMVKCNPEIEKEPQYWICHSLTAEKENKLEDALTFYHIALDKGVQPAEISQEFERLLCSYSSQNENQWHSQKEKKMEEKTKMNTPRKPLVDNKNIFRSTLIMFDLSLSGSKSYKSVKAVATPVRRSARLSRTPTSNKKKGSCVKNLEKLPYNIRNNILVRENSALKEIHPAT